MDEKINSYNLLFEFLAGFNEGKTTMSKETWEELKGMSTDFIQMADDIDYLYQTTKDLFSAEAWMTKKHKVNLTSEKGLKGVSRIVEDLVKCFKSEIEFAKSMATESSGMIEKEMEPMLIELQKYKDLNEAMNLRIFNLQSELESAKTKAEARDKEQAGHLNQAMFDLENYMGLYEEAKSSVTNMKDKASKEVNNLAEEKETFKKTISELNVQLNEEITKTNDLKAEIKNLKSEKAKIESDSFVVSKRLNTIEEEHKAEIYSMQIEVEELLSKNKELERRLKEFKDNGSLSDKNENEAEGGIFDEMVFGDESMNFDNKSLGNRRQSLTMRRSSVLQLSFAETNCQTNPPPGSPHTDARVKELEQKNAEISNLVAEAKKQISSLEETIDSLQTRLKEESKKLEVNKRKVELKDKELDEYRAKLMRDNEKFSVLVNEANEEVERKEHIIQVLRKQLKTEMVKTRGAKGAEEQMSIMDRMNESFKKMF